MRIKDNYKLDDLITVINMLDCNEVLKCRKKERPKVSIIIEENEDL